jgi:hypothetical protein
VIWIIVPLLALVIFGLYVRREAERIRAEDLRPRLRVKLKLAGDGMATPAEIHERQALESEIEKRGIGSIADTGSGEGWATLQVSVPEVEQGFDDILRVIDALGIENAKIERVTTALQ